jgi:hypothetical protein
MGAKPSQEVTRGDEMWRECKAIAPHCRGGRRNHRKSRKRSGPRSNLITAQTDDELAR